MYEWGTKPTQEMLNQAIRTDVPNDYQFAKGEYGQFQHEWKTREVCREDRIPTEKQFTDSFIAQTKAKGADIFFIQVTRTQEFAYFSDRGDWMNYYVTFTINDCWFKGDFDPATWALIIIVLAGISVYIIYSMMPVLYKWSSVSPLEVIGYKASDWVFFLIIGVIILLFVGVGFTGLGVKVGKK